jgi:aspartyl-tRNA(Asn)/glutamyl-tRNA(Gln) amidotransferase subunit A
MELPWMGDACALVEAYRSGELSPAEVLDATFAAIERSALNAFCHTDPERARAWLAAVDIERQPFAGVPIGVKEIDGGVAGWPDTHASLVFADQVSGSNSTQVDRLLAAGAVPVGLTTASEFGGINCTHTRLHGTTRNPWNLDRTPGGSSGGSAAAVAGGLVPLATGGDGGGSIRIPAGFCGLFGLKATRGRIPRGPRADIVNMTVTVGCLSRSVRDTARWFDICNGFDPRDPFSLPRVEGWEAGLGTHREALRGKRAAIVADLGVAVLDPGVRALVSEQAELLAADAGLRIVDAPVKVPHLSAAWAFSGTVGIMALLGDRWPACEQDLTPEIQFACNIASRLYNLDMAARIERERQDFNETMAAIFDEVDFVFAATSPDVAFAATGPLPTVVGGVDLVAELGFETAMGNNGCLTIPSNIYGNPAVSIPCGHVRDLPVGLQVLGRHYEEQLLLDLAFIAERERPWPLVAPGSPV